MNLLSELHQGSPLVDRIGDIGSLRAPNEAAGFLLPDGSVIELANRSSTPRTRFEFNPDDVAIALEAAQLRPTSEQWDRAVFWHTHPGGGLGPSSIDMKNRVGPITHLVVALTDEGYIPTIY